MDPLSDVMSTFELGNALVGGFTAGGRWSVRFDAYKGVKCYTVTAGSCWLRVGNDKNPVHLQAGDCFLLPHGREFLIGSDLEHPSEDWRRHFGSALDGFFVALNAGSDVTILGGHFDLVGPQVEMLYGLLPPVVHLHRLDERDAMRWMFDRLRGELTDRKPGGSLMAQHLASMILVQALRLHLKGAEGVGWIFALSDPSIGAAIAAIHREPARQWTVASLAHEAGMSRSSFAALFARRVGAGPIEYLTRWRMILAGRRLTQGQALDQVSYGLGYASAPAFRSAFRRVMGQTPRRYASALGRTVDE